MKILLKQSGVVLTGIVGSLMGTILGMVMIGTSVGVTLLYLYGVPLGIMFAITLVSLMALGDTLDEVQDDKVWGLFKTLLITILVTTLLGTVLQAVGFAYVGVLRRLTGLWAVSVGSMMSLLPYIIVSLWVLPKRFEDVGLHKNGAYLHIALIVTSVVSVQLMTSFYDSGVQLGAIIALASYAIAYKLAQLLTHKEKELTS